MSRQTFDNTAIGVGEPRPEFQVAFGGHGVRRAQYCGFKVNDIPRGIRDVVAVGVADVLTRRTAWGDGADSRTEFRHGIFASENQKQHAGLGVGLVGKKILENVITDQFLRGVVPGIGIGDERRGIGLNEFLAGRKHPSADKIEPGAGDQARDNAARARFANRVRSDEHIGKFFGHR